MLHSAREARRSCVSSSDRDSCWQQSGSPSGALLAAAAMPAARSLLFKVSPFDPLTFTAVAAFLAAVAFLASYLPARRATMVDPVVALRGE